MRFIPFLLICLLLVVPVSATQSTFEPIFESAACPLELPKGTVESEDIRCGYVTVPEEHGNPSGNTIRLAVAVIPSASDNTQAPLVMAQGGPGGSSLDAFVGLMLGPFGDFFAANRDIIIFDQRGTLYSEPNLMCEEVFEVMLETLDDNLTSEAAHAATEQALIACRERLVSEGINLSAYDSVENAADVPLVVQALGYTDYHFYGVSYGSLLAFHLLRDHPEGLQSVIVDAIVPTQVNFIPATPVNGVRSLRLLFESCAADAECSSNFPNLEATYVQLLETLTTTPATVQITDPETGEPRNLVLNGDVLAGLTFQTLYSTEILPLLPKYISEMAQGNFRWLELLGGELLLQHTTAQGMNLSVLCAEDSDYAPEEIVLEGVYPQFERGLEAFSQSYLALCSMWQVEALDMLVNEATVSDIPTLIFSGEFDPITPPAWGEVAGETLSNSYVYEFPGVGHGSLFGGLCPIGIALSFLENPTEAPDSACIEEMQISFLPPAAALFETEVFGVEIPLGWDNASTDTVATFTDPNTEARFDVLAVEAADLESGILKILAELKPELSPTPLDSTESDVLGRTWLQNVYLNGFSTAVAVLATQAENQVVAIVLEATPDAFGTLEKALINVWLSIQIK